MLFSRVPEVVFPTVPADTESGLRRAGRTCLALAIAAAIVASPAVPSRALSSGDVLVEAIATPWTGDFDSMAERKVIRALVPFSSTFFFLDGGTVRGLAVEILGQFEQALNKGRAKKKRIVIKIVPTHYDRLVEDLVEGRGDLAVANLTVTDDREQLIEFSDPFATGISEQIVTPASHTPITELSDLSGLTVHARKSSAYYASLARANTELEANGLSPVEIVEAEETLDDGELLEMVNAGLIPAVVVDSHIGDFWSQLLPDIRLHDYRLRSDGRIAWAFRKDSPKFAEVVNGFVKTAKQGTGFGNTILKRYYQDVKWMHAATTPPYTAAFGNLRPLFQKYGEKYDVDWILIAAQAFQESRFDPKARSRAGAVGLMQIKPSTAADPNVAIHGIQEPERNVEAGVKYLRFLADRYFADEGIDEFNRLLFALAAYNAGPSRFKKLRKQARDPNAWFDHVEWVVADRISMEPVRYVNNIYRYYLIFRGIEERTAARQGDPEQTTPITHDAGTAPD